MSNQPNSSNKTCWQSAYQTLIQRKIQRKKKHRGPMASLAHLSMSAPHVAAERQGRIVVNAQKLLLQEAKPKLEWSRCCSNRWWRNMEKYVSKIIWHIKKRNRKNTAINNYICFLDIFFGYLDISWCIPYVYIYIIIYPLSSLTCPRVRDQRVFAESLHITRETGSGAASIDRLADAEWDCSWVCWKCRINMDEPTQSW